MGIHKDIKVEVGAESKGVEGKSGIPGVYGKRIAGEFPEENKSENVSRILVDNEGNKIGEETIEEDEDGTYNKVRFYTEVPNEVSFDDVTRFVKYVKDNTEYYKYKLLKLAAANKDIMLVSQIHWLIGHMETTNEASEDFYNTLTHSDKDGCK